MLRDNMRKPAPTKLSQVEQTIETGDIVMVKGIYLSPSLIVSSVSQMTEQAQVYWFDKNDRMHVGQLPTSDLIVRSKHTDKDLRLAQ
jgi:hypothetical protein